PARPVPSPRPATAPAYTASALPSSLRASSAAYAAWERLASPCQPLDALEPRRAPALLDRPVDSRPICAVWATLANHNRVCLRNVPLRHRLVCDFPNDRFLQVLERQLKFHHRPPPTISVA